MRPHLLVILGPTASGKSALAVTLAQHLNGEVISADSRQVYRGLDIGTGKVTQKEMGGIFHHLLDVIDPTNTFSVADFKRCVEQTITEIIHTKKLPILAGGTGFYVQAIVDNLMLPEVPPRPRRREELKKKSAEELYSLLVSLDPIRAESIEQANSRRLIRAIEIAETLGYVPEIDTTPPQNYTKSLYDVIQIGLDVPYSELEGRIRDRVEKRLEQGWKKEVEQLVLAGVPQERFKEFGLGYMIIQEKPNCSQEELTETITTAELQYAKRQLRWFKRDTRIHWFAPSEDKKICEMIKNQWNLS